MNSKQRKVRIKRLRNLAVSVAERKRVIEARRLAAEQKASWGEW